MKIASVVVSASPAPRMGRILLFESYAEYFEAITRTTMPYFKIYTIVPSKLRNDRFLGASSVTVLSITKDIFVYLVITIRCKRRVKNCKFQFDSSNI